VTSGVCAAHAGQPAFVTCRVCGSPACAYCLSAPDTDGDTCTRCREREAPTGVIAWERRDLGIGKRFVRTVRQVLGQTGPTFSELREGSVGPALGYVALVYALTSLSACVVLAPFLLLALLGWQTPLAVADTAALVPVLVAALCGGPIVQAGVGVVAAAVLGSVYHAGAKLVGGAGGFDVSLRAAAYGLTVVLVWAPLTVSLLLPTIGLVVLLVVFAGQLVWGANVGVIVARSHHGLEGARATFAGWFPAALLIVALAVIGGGAWLVRDVTEPSQAPDLYYPDPEY